MFKSPDLTSPVEASLDDWRSRPYLIIGGTTKAATTSLFEYLGAHPQVCASSMKETRFFLDPEYPLDSKYRLEDGADKYQEFFHQSNAATRLWVEATPDYLYSKGSPLKIRQTLKNVRLVFVLREPKARVVSWYRFARQNNLLPETATLEEFVASQVNSQSESENIVEQHTRAVEQGKYASYLRPYFETFGRQNIAIIFMEELAKDPRKATQDLCNFAGIASEFYDIYKFEVYNRTEDLKSPAIHGIYRNLRFFLKKKIHDRPAIKSFLRKIRLKIEPVYLELNRRPSSPEVKISPHAEAILNSYYQPANRELEELLGRRLPWSGK